MVNRNVVVSLGGRPYPLTGRAAVIVAMAAVLEHDLNLPQSGEIRFRFNGEKISLVIERHYASVQTGVACLAPS